MPDVPSPSVRYAPRVVDTELDELLRDLAALHLDGAKAVGKTTTALQRVESAWSLDVPEQADIARADPTVLLAGPKPVLIDEWQRVPAVWDAVKTVVNVDRSPNQFLLAGSTPSAGTTHSGAARIVSVRMRPMTLPERGVCSPTVSLAALVSDPAASVRGQSSFRLEDYVDEVLASGFPGLRGLSGRALSAQLDGYLTRIVDVEMEEAGLKIRRPATLRAWLAAYAAATATTASWETIRHAATPGHDGKPARSSTTPYIDVLTRLRVIDDVPAWLPSNNHLRTLGQAPKHHLMDPALAARLARVNKATLLRGGGPKSPQPRDGTFLGALFESLATLSVRVFASAAGADVAHLRLHEGSHEVDMCVLPEDGGVFGIEVKLASDVSDEDVRHLLWLRDEIDEEFLGGVVLTTGSTAYRRPDGIAVVPLGLLGP